MGEIEHYVDLEDKTYERSHEVQDVKNIYFLLDGHVQEAGRNTNERWCYRQYKTLDYFVDRIYLFLLKIGINPERFRFRQTLLMGWLIMLRISGMPLYTIRDIQFHWLNG